MDANRAVLQKVVETGDERSTERVEHSCKVAETQTGDESEINRTCRTGDERSTERVESRVSHSFACAALAIGAHRIWCTHLAICRRTHGEEEETVTDGC
jgi:hypothetical protein